MGAESVITCRRNEVEVSRYASYVQRKAYLFHRVFNQATTQRQVFAESITPIITKALEGCVAARCGGGALRCMRWLATVTLTCVMVLVTAATRYNCTVFAYGQTGTGKTFTLEGDMHNPARAGIIPRSIHHLFQHIKKCGDAVRHVAMSRWPQLAHRRACDHGTMCHASHIAPPPAVALSRAQAEFCITVSHLEIYNEELADLLSPDYGTTDMQRQRAISRRTTSRSLWQAARRRGINMIYMSKALKAGGSGAEESDTDMDVGTPRTARGRGLRVVKDPSRGVIVDGLTEIEVKSAEEIFEILARSIKKRVTHETQMNKQSSRSHAIFTIQIASTKVDEMGTATRKVGRLNLVDLSGSENLKRSGSVGDRQREASHINQGLLSLGRVIKGIVDKAKYIPCVATAAAPPATTPPPPSPSVGSRARCVEPCLAMSLHPHAIDVPRGWCCTLRAALCCRYRDSKLTRLLEESLGGNSVTLMILTVSPNSLDCDETVSTLNYANMAKMIFNTPKENVKVVKSGGGVAGGAGADGGEDPGKEHHGKDSGPVVTPVLPWEGAVPIRKPRGASHGVAAAPRLYHATSVEWVEKHFLSASTGTLSTKVTTPAVPQHAPARH